MKRSRLFAFSRFFLLLPTLILIATASHAGTIPVSDALGALIQQADQTYARPAGESMQDLFVNDPQSATSFLGLAMHGQRRYSLPDSPYYDHFFALKLEVNDYLGRVAQSVNYRSNITGMEVNQEYLVNLFEMFMFGKMNDWASEHGFVDPSRYEQPLILDRVVSEWADESQAARARLILQEEKEGIVLFGETAPPAKYDRPETNPYGPPVQTQRSKPPAAPLTGCSSAKLTIIADHSTTASAIGSYHTARVNFGDSATIVSKINKVYVTYKTRFGETKREMNREDQVRNGYYRAWNNYVSLSGYSASKHGPLKVIFEAFDSQGEMTCRGEIQK